MARVKWDQMTDESQAMVKKVGLISIGGMIMFAFDKMIFPPPDTAKRRRLCRLACPIQEVVHGLFSDQPVGVRHRNPSLKTGDGSGCSRLQGQSALLDDEHLQAEELQACQMALT